MGRAAKNEQNAGRFVSQIDGVSIDFEPLPLPDQLPLERDALQALIDTTHQQATRRIVESITAQITAQIRERAFIDANARAQAAAVATIERYL